jgi:hypothetical protein
MSIAHLNDKGLQIDVKIGISLSGIDSAVLNVLKPNDVVVWPALLVTPLADGILRYTTQANDLDVAGNYKIQAQVTFASGAVLFGDTATLRIVERYGPS